MPMVSYQRLQKPLKRWYYWAYYSASRWHSMMWRDMKATTELGRTYRALCRTTWYTSNRRVKTITDFNETGDDGVLGGIRWSKSKQSAPHFRQTTTSTSPYSRIMGRTHSWHHTNSVQALKPRECWPVGLLTPTSNFNEVDIVPHHLAGDSRFV